MGIRKKAAVLLSGGLDSSVTTFLLKQQGYDVVTVTGKMFCSPIADTIVENACKVAEALDVSHYVCDVSDFFEENIINYFENSYKSGETPNPCIMCNKKIKWGKIFDFAVNELGADFVATGHYASIIEDDGVYKLFPAKDKNKDQLYYLFELNQDQLSKTIFPLSGMVKDDIRRIASENDLPSKSSKESQDICFIPKPLTTKKFLEDRLGEKQGDFILKSTAEKLGNHNGCWKYTVGQRKGIGIAYSEPLYVLGTDIGKNEVYLGLQSELYSDFLIINDLKFQSGVPLENFNAQVKIRYNMQKVPARISKTESGYRVDFENPVSAVTKGQALVIYDENDGHLVAGGWI